MRRVFAVILSLLMILQLTACGAGSLPTQSSKDNKTDRPSGSRAETAAPVTTAPVTEPETEPPHIPPRTAQEPPSQTLRGLSHLSGVEEYWTDPETDREHIVFEDLGEDGHTRTMNCFDESGNLLWWEAFEYDENEQVAAVLRWRPDEMKLISREDLTRENGVLTGMKHYECYYPETGGQMEAYMTFEESYYPDGNVHFHMTFYPFLELGEYYIEHQYEYAEDGQEVYHVLYDPYGGILEEYAYGEKVLHLPDTVAEIYKLLNEASEEEFETLWDACQKHLAEKNLTKSWEKLCHTFSGLMDIYHGSSGQEMIYQLREEYGLKLFQNASKAGGLYRNNPPSLYDVLTSIKEDKVSLKLFAKIYYPGCCSDLGGTIWLPALYDEYRQKMPTEGDAAVPREPGAPIRILIIDSSDSIRGNEMNEELFLSDTEKTGWIIDRAETLLKGLFHGQDVKKVVLTSYPELADVVLEILTTYPFAGQYKYSSGTLAQVWNTVVAINAYDMSGGNSASATFKHLAGQTVSVSGGTKIYMRIPELTDEKYSADAQAFVQTIFSWFPDLAQ